MGVCPGFGGFRRVLAFLNSRHDLSHFVRCPLEAVEEFVSRRMIFLQAFPSQRMNFFGFPVHLLRILQIFQIVFREHPVGRPAGDNDRFFGFDRFIQHRRHRRAGALN
ncbi:hypothetical protein D3C76_1616820 [compost metagenome]